MPVLLTEHDIRRLLPMPDLIVAMSRALAEFSAGRVVQPVRTVLDVGGKAFFGVMPAALENPPSIGAKLVTVYPGNHDRGLPSHLATIILMDQATGALVALLDGRYITEARTGAVSAVSVQQLARPRAHVLAIIGSGVQAKSHLEAIRVVRPIDDVRVWSPSAHKAEAFAREMTATTGLSIRAVADPARALDGADLIVLATASKTPVIRSEDVAPGAHIAAVGACRPTEREMPTALVARARLFVDSRAAALVEAGDIVLPIQEGAFSADHIAGELGELVLGRAEGRRTDDEVTMFKSLGLAVEDVATAHLVVERAQAAGLGLTFSLT